jgi:hypothetical protein
MKRVQCKAFARSTGAQCQAKAVPGKEVCRVHGGASEGAPKENQNAKKHGIYGKHLTEEEKADFDDVSARIGTLDAEITLLRFRMRRALDAEAAAAANDPDALEVVQRHDREASEFGPGDETVRKRVDYGEHVERIARRVESLEKTRAELLRIEREAGGGVADDGMTATDTFISPDEPIPDKPIL